MEIRYSGRGLPIFVSEQGNFWWIFFRWIHLIPSASLGLLQMVLEIKRFFFAGEMSFSTIYIANSNFDIKSPSNISALLHFATEVFVENIQNTELFKQQRSFLLVDQISSIKYIKIVWLGWFYRVKCRVLHC